MNKTRNTRNIVSVGGAGMKEAKYDISHSYNTEVGAQDMTDILKKIMNLLIDTWTKELSTEELKKLKEMLGE